MDSGHEQVMFFHCMEMSPEKGASEVCFPHARATLHNRAWEGTNLTSTYSKCQNSCRLHGVFSEEKITWRKTLKRTVRSFFYLSLVSFLLLSFSASFASVIITTSFMVVGLLVALRTNLSLHPHSRHSYFGGVHPM